MPGMNRDTGAALSERDHILQSLRTLILTPVGSRIKRRDYGSVIPHLIDQPLNSATLLRLYSATAAAILHWEPRVTLKSISLSIDLKGAATLDIDMTINGQTDRVSLAIINTISSTPAIPAETADSVMYLGDPVQYGVRQVLHSGDEE